MLNEVARFYLKNLQGDVVGITDAAGNIEARYIYDSWGKLISITDSEGNDITGDSEHIGCINPLRYRGYYYDSETGLYYLNARYYDPHTGRFINADSNLHGGLNLFAYCINNPVNLNDYTGEDPWDRFNDVWDAYWNAAVFLQNATLADPAGHERATIIIRRTDPITGVAYYTYPDPAIGVGTDSVDASTLISTYLSESPNKLFLHTHGHDPRNGLEHYNAYSKGDYRAADSNKILLGLIAPDGTAQMYDGTSGYGTKIDFMTPPAGVRIPRNPYYDALFVGFFRRKMAKAEYIYPLVKS